MNSFFSKLPLSQCFIIVTEVAFPALFSAIGHCVPIGVMTWKNLSWKLWRKLISLSEYEETLLRFFWNVSDHQKVTHRVWFRLAAVGKLLGPERSDQNQQIST